MEILKKLINNEKITDNDIENELYEMCEREHCSCNQNCLMYALENKVPDTANDFEVNCGCDYFKDGEKMLKKLRELK